MRLATSSSATPGASSTVRSAEASRSRRASASGSGMYTRFSSRRRSASSRSHGKLVAANSMTGGWLPPAGPALTPSICTSSSLFTRRLASCSPAAPRAVHSASISSMKMVAGAAARAMSNRQRTRRSDSPRYLLASVLLLTEKKVVPHSVATALASIVLPKQAEKSMHRSDT